MENTVNSLLRNMKYDANTMQVDHTWLGTRPTDQHIIEKSKYHNHQTKEK